MKSINPKLTILLILFLSASMSCEDLTSDMESSNPDSTTNIEPSNSYENSVKPENNNLIQGKATVGNDNTFSEYSFIEGSSLGGFYVIGRLNSGSVTSIEVGDKDNSVDYFDPVLIRYNSNGGEVWSLPTRPGFLVKRMRVIPPGYLDDEEYILLSGSDDNEENILDPDRTRLMLFNSSGKVVSQFNQDFFLSINDFKKVRNVGDWVHFISVGEVYWSDREDYYPGFFEFAIHKDTKEIKSINIKQLRDLDDDGFVDFLFENVRFKNIVITNDGNYIVSGELQGNANFTTQVFIYEISPNDITSYKQKWNWTNQGQVIRNIKGGLLINGNNVIITGYLADRRKREDYSSPYIFSVNIKTGQINFENSYAYTDNPDRLFSSKVIDNKIVSAGVSSRFWCANCDRELTIGNGWIFSIDANTGDRISNITFGSDKLRTELSEFYIEGNTLWGVGIEQTTTSTGKALIIKMNKNNLF